MLPRGFFPAKYLGFLYFTTEILPGKPGKIQIYQTFLSEELSRRFLDGLNLD